MSSQTCGPPQYEYYYTRARCLERDVDDCAKGWTNMGTVASKSKSWANYCFGDVGSSRKNRYKRKCRRPKPEENYPSENKAKCCLGILKGKENCHNTWCGTNKTTCDAAVLDFCSKPENASRPECGCALPAKYYENSRIFGPVPCTATSCTNNTNAYRLSDQLGVACNIVNCTLGDLSVLSSDSNVDIAKIQQYCGNRFNDQTGKNEETQKVINEILKNNPNYTPYNSGTSKFVNNPFNWGLIATSVLSGIMAAML